MANQSTERVSPRTYLLFLVVYLGIAFVAMLGVRTLPFGVYIEALLALAVHGGAGIAAYKLTVEKHPYAHANLDDAVETVAVTYGIFAAAKHAVLGLTGLAEGGVLGAVDHGLEWAVAKTFISTSLVPDVAILGIVPCAIRLATGGFKGEPRKQESPV